MEQNILTTAQQKAIAHAADEPRLASFYLSGGTALAAYYLRHRVSDDLDFFTGEQPDAIFLHAFAKNLGAALGASAVRFERLYERNQFFFQLNNEELKVEFTRYPFPHLEQPRIMEDGLRVDSIRDIAANKLMALLDRFDPKDFVDLFFVLREIRLVDVRRDSEKKFGAAIGDLFLGGELAKVRRVAALPKMIAPLTIEELKAFFSERAKELAPAILSE